MVPLVEVAQHWAAGASRVCMQIKNFVVSTSNNINIHNTQIYLIISKPNNIFPTQYYVLTFNKVTLPTEKSYPGRLWKLFKSMLGWKYAACC